MNDTRRAVLDAIADGPETGPALADRLGISRSAVWKHVEALRAAGFEVAGTPEGYRLESVPAFGGPAVEFGLEAPFTVEYHDAIDSTNARARALAEEGASDVVVLADEQTGGRGRLDRAWASPSGGIWSSLLLRPALPPAEVPLLTLAAGVAVVEAVGTVGVDAGLKWPNDVLVPTDDGPPAKLAGVLTEMAGEADRVAWVVLGVGINANVDPADLPPGATSLRALVGDVDRRAVTQASLEAIDRLRGDPGAILPAWRDATVTLGRRVRIETPSGSVVGEAVEVEPPGHLVVETDAGRVRVHAGDCEHLRPV